MNVIIVDDNTAVVSKKFMKNASSFGSPEFFKWREVKAMYPNAKMYTKSIKKNPDRETNRNRSYKNMAEYKERRRKRTTFTISIGIEMIMLLMMTRPIIPLKKRKTCKKGRWKQ